MLLIRSSKVGNGYIARDSVSINLEGDERTVLARVSMYLCRLATRLVAQVLWLESLICCNGLISKRIHVQFTRTSIRFDQVNNVHGILIGLQGGHIICMYHM